MRSHSSTSPATLYAPGRSSPEISYRCPGRNDSWPPVDDHLARPEHREEYIDGHALYAAPAKSPHGFAHTALSSILDVYTAPGFSTGTDMLTRVNKDSDVAPDAAICKVDNDDSWFAKRQLERLAFEIVDTTRLGVITRKAELLTKRGVQRIFCIDIVKNRVLEWNTSKTEWTELSMDASIDDECLEQPLPIRTLLLSAKRKNAIAQALVDQNNEVIQEALQEREAKGKAEGLRTSIVHVLQARGLPVPASLHSKLDACSDLTQLTQWLTQAATLSSLDEVQ